MQERDDQPVTACKFYEKQSRKTGQQYFSGRLGGLKVLIFKSRDVTDDGSPIWELKLAQAAPYEKRNELTTRRLGQPARSNRLTTASTSRMKDRRRRSTPGEQTEPGAGVSTRRYLSDVELAARASQS